MSDERPLPAEADPERYGETLLYDHGKFVTTLSLIVLGGVLTLTQASGHGELDRYNIGLILGSVSVGGVIAFGTASALVDARARQKAPSRRLPFYLKGAMTLIGVRLGVFLVMWSEALS